MISTHGYRKILVGVHHPKADSKGYAYEHQLIAEHKLGRRLLPNEIVHHIDGNRLNNDPSNLDIVPSIRHHFVKHRKNNKLRLPDEANPEIYCACGCGITFNKYDEMGRPRKFISGHNIPIKERPLCACGCGERVKHIKSIFKANHGSKNYRSAMALCACGCGNRFRKYDKHGRERKYLLGHARRTNAVLE